MTNVVEIQGIESLKERRITTDITDNLKLELVYNTYDNFIYLAILNNKNEYIVGFTKLVPNINFLQLTNNEYRANAQLRCIKINKFAEERDYITIDNLNRDYLLFLIEVE